MPDLAHGATTLLHFYGNLCELQAQLTMVCWVDFYRLILPPALLIIHIGT